MPDFVRSGHFDRSASVSTAPESLALVDGSLGMTVRVSAFGIITLLRRTQPENGPRRSNPAIPLQDSFISKTMPVWGPLGPDTARILSHSPRRESVYATLLLMSSTLGGDVAPAPGAVPAPGGCIGARRPRPVATPEAAIASDCSIASALATPQRDRGAAAAASPLLIAVRPRRLRFRPQCPSLPPVAAAARPSPLRAAILHSSGRHGRDRKHNRRSNDCCAADAAPLRVPRPASRRW